ncbi:MAG: hypothetical protein GF317_05835 [Candidatus Lokiarchaeota archaeon]|nr:hypothetical protein [Candidatus Lokiarchaeota archaeon]
MSIVKELLEEKVENSEKRKFKTILNILDNIIKKLNNIYNERVRRYFSDGIIKKTFTYIYNYFSRFKSQGIPTQYIIISIIYLIVREFELPYDIDDLERVSNVSKETIFKYVYPVATRLNINIEPIDYKIYIKKFCDELSLSHYFRKKAERLLEILLKKEKNGLVILQGKNPKTIVAAIIYYINKMTENDPVITYKKLGTIGKISTDIISKLCREFRDSLQELDNNALQ